MYIYIYIYIYICIYIYTPLEAKFLYVWSFHPAIQPASHESIHLSNCPVWVSIHRWLLSKVVYPALREWGVYIGGAVNVYMMYPYIHTYIHTLSIHPSIQSFIHLSITHRWLLSKVIYPALREWGVYIGGAVNVYIISSSNHPSVHPSIYPSRVCLYTGGF